jgi:DNA-binding CsgD family transcriptional regulator/predicted negative regulator of RcsB-dependent stress response
VSSQDPPNPTAPEAGRPPGQKRETAASVEAGDAALQAGLWDEARAAFETALESGEDPAALEGMSQAAWWLGEHEHSHRCAERAYVRYREEGDGRSAARVALWLAREYSVVFGPAARQGWVARAETLLAEAGDCTEAGWLAIQRSGAGGAEELERAARFALDVARRCKDADLEAVALGHLGMALVLAGRVSEGMACLDESMASVSAGEVRDFVAAGTAYCTMLGACERTLDFQRAEQWCRAAEDFSRRHQHVPLFALCRTFYGDVLIATGRWAQAEEMLRSALEAETARAWAQLALVRLAKLRTRQGRLEEADRLLEGLESDPQSAPVLAEAQLARGQATLAASVLERALGEGNLEGLSRLPLLTRLVDARVAQGDPVAGRHAAELVRELADVSDLESVSALADLAEGKVARARGDTDDARKSLESAVRKLGRAQMPLELAEARLELARCLAASQPQMALADAKAALKVFESLGAERHADAAAELLRSLGQKGRYIPKQRGDLTKREQEVLRLLGEGLTNPEIAERLYITRKTVEHHVGHVLAKLGTRNRAEAVAYALSQRERLGEK